jgi:hypothetical protein
MSKTWRMDREGGTCGLAGVVRIYTTRCKYAASFEYVRFYRMSHAQQYTQPKKILKIFGNGTAAELAHAESIDSALAHGAYLAHVTNGAHSMSTDIMIRTNYFYPRWMITRIAAAADAQGITRVAFIRRAIAVALMPRTTPAPTAHADPDIRAIEARVSKYETLLRTLNTRYDLTETLSVGGCMHGRVPASSCTVDECLDGELHRLWNEVME